MSSTVDQAVSGFVPAADSPDEAPSASTWIRRWRWPVVGLVLTCLTLVAAMNLVIDPYCAYRAGLPMLLDFKPCYDLPKTKASLVAKLRPTAIILGASPALVFNPRWEGWGPYGAMNLSIGAASMDKDAQALRFAVETGRVERVLLCTDLSQFKYNLPLESFDESRFSPQFSSTSYHLHNLLSPTASLDSLRTVSAYLGGARSEYTLLGDVRGGKFQYTGSSREHFLKAIKKLQRQYANFQRSSEAITGLREIVKLCQSKNVELTVVIAPVHALYLESLASQDLLDEYENWLQDVTTIVAEESGGKFPVWDFAGYNRYTTEETPLYDRSPAPTYYQEPGQFNAALADKVLARVYHSPNADPQFGVLLKTADVGQRIADLRTERAAWLAQRPEAINLLSVIFPQRRLETPREARR